MCASFDLFSFLNFNSSMQAYGTTQLPLRSLDFSHNSIRRLPDKAFSGVEVSPSASNAPFECYTRKPKLFPLLNAFSLFSVFFLFK